MCACIYQPSLLVHIYGLDVVGAEAVFALVLLQCVVDESLAVGHVQVQSAVVGSYPQIFLPVFHDAAYNVVAQ